LDHFMTAAVFTGTSQTLEVVQSLFAAKAELRGRTGLRAAQALKVAP
jgi:hypothetical protein